MELGKNAGFILASYAATIVIIGGFVWQSVRRYGAAKRRFAEKPESDHG